MPTYGYRCQACGVDFDVVQRMSDPAEANCPACGSAGKRLFFPVGITFKGQGFYKTDSRSSSSDSTPTPGEAASTSKSSEDSKSSTASKTSTDTKTGSTPTSSPSTPTASAT